MSDLPFDYEPTPPNLGAPAPRKCRRHVWAESSDLTTGQVYVVCLNCPAVKDPVRSRRGRNNKNRGNAIQAQVCEALGWLNIGGANGPADGLSLVGDRMFIGQIKSGGRFPGWMANELDKLPRTGGRIPVLAVAETPGAGKKRRVLMVMDIKDYIDLHGGAS